MVVIPCLYVDDILIVGSDDKMIKSTKNILNSRFDMKDMRLADVILEIKITRISNRLILKSSHTMWIKSLRNSTRMILELLEHH